MASEIERKFLVQLPIEWPGEEVVSAVIIDQGYLTPRGTDVEVRLRRAREITPETAGSAAPASKAGAHGVTKVWKMTVKVSTGDASSGLVREEIEVSLNEEEFERLWPLTEGRRVQKVRTSRFLLKPGGETLEACLDDFRGALNGLSMVEVEFGSEEEAAAYVPPPFFGREVTGDPRYRNDSLADAPRPPDEESGR